ncbi:MAG: IPT/TIG domain-containing protein [Planctomycetes bacterium]|nr:IPT/TIG domain-containing protein [Planctomycetota bacterium]
MRKAGLIAGVILLAGVFAAVWFTLGPGGGHNTSAPQIADSSVADLGGNPLTPCNPEQTQDNVDEPLPPGGVQPGKDSIKGESRSSERPDPSVEVKQGKQSPGETTGPGKSSPSDGVEVPVPSPGVPNPPPQPTSFIKGHRQPPGQNLGNTRPGARRIGKPAGVKQLSDVTPKLMQDRRGLYAQYFRMDSPDVTKLDTSTPDMVRIDQTIYFPNAEAFEDLPIPLENFAAEWTGFLVIPEAGDYWLFWGADNGGRVELDGETVLLQDGMVRYVEVSTVLTLEPGLHPLKIEFAQAHNAVADWAKCAANFMYVPEGQTKPVPVPPEMLMVPEWMWSDNAPIITSLSKTEGEIGDEIAIKGQNLGAGKSQTIPMDKWVSLTRNGSWLRPEQSLDQASTPERLVSVTVAGQLAEVLEQSDTSLRIRIPIGARTGDVVVYVEKYNGYYFRTGIGVIGYSDPVPSNDLPFTVTTQFGLMASWHKLDGWSNFDFEVLDSRDPELTRLESTAGKQPGPAGYGTCAVRWEGRLGIPIEHSENRKGGGTALEFWTYAPGRITLGAVTSLTQDVGDGMYVVAMPADALEPGYVPLRIEMTMSQIESPQWFVLYQWQSLAEIEEGEIGSVTDSIELQAQYFFPASVPPEPPVISNAKAVWPEEEQPPVPPYDVDTSRPSVKVGQEFTFSITTSTPPEIDEPPPSVTIDGVTLNFDAEKDPLSPHMGRLIWICRATMPDGVGEGRMVARQSIVSSEPYFIDIANRGLVAYLYDIPEGSGLDVLPELDPLTCFKVRKDRAINFEDTADFDLPFPAETFVIEWLGGLIIEEEGDYEFICRSDDGMKLWLDDNVVIDANHRQAPAENKATVHLVPGTYRFRMQFFENNQHEVCVLEWRATRGEGEAQEEFIPRQVIPAKAFTLDIHPPFPNKTSTGKRTDGS